MIYKRCAGVSLRYSVEIRSVNHLLSELLEINGQGVATASVEYTGHTAFFTPQV